LACIGGAASAGAAATGAAAAEAIIAGASRFTRMRRPPSSTSISVNSFAVSSSASSRISAVSMRIALPPVLPGSLD
jgi:hypothetical protein